MQNKLIYKFKDFLKERYSFPVRKLPIHTHLGCPHRENRSGVGGCVYCYNPGFSEIPDRFTNVQKQIEDGITRSRNRGFEGKFIAYFQTETNTFGKIDLLESWWRTIEQFPNDFVGLAVGTRPDCISEEVLQVLSDIGKNFMVWLELGLQSANDETLQKINRGHDYQCFVEAVENAKTFKNILLSAHIILGLPGENYKDMLFTIEEINRLKLDGVKIHHLQVVKHTELADWHKEGKVILFSDEEYIQLLVDLLPHLSKEICVHRLVGDIRDDLLIAPKWKLPKTRIIQMVDERLNEEKIFQGSLLN
jgi:uncharacterized protein